MNKVVSLWIVFLLSVSVSQAKENQESKIIAKVKAEFSKLNDKARFDTLMTTIEVMADYASRCKIEVKVMGDDWVNQPGCSKLLVKRHKFKVYGDWYFKNDSLLKRYKITPRMLKIMSKGARDNAYIKEYTSN